MTLQSIDPASGEVIEAFDEPTDAQLDATLERAQQAFRSYRSGPGPHPPSRGLGALSAAAARAL